MNPYGLKQGGAFAAPSPTEWVAGVRRHLITNQVVKPVESPKYRRLTPRVHVLFFAFEIVALFFMIDTISMIVSLKNALNGMAPILVIPTDQTVSLVLAPMILSIHGYLTARDIWKRATRTRMAHMIAFCVLSIFIVGIAASTTLTTSLSETAEEYRYVRCQKWETFKYANLYYGLTDAACRDWRERMTEPGL